MIIKPIASGNASQTTPVQIAYVSFVVVHKLFPHNFDSCKSFTSWGVLIN